VVYLITELEYGLELIFQAIPIFAALPLLCIIVNVNQRVKNGVGLGTRLTHTCTKGRIVQCPHLLHTIQLPSIKYIKHHVSGPSGKPTNMLM